MSPRDHIVQQTVIQTFGFCVEGENRGRSYVWVEADSVEAGRARIRPLFPGCRLKLISDDEAVSMR